VREEGKLLNPGSRSLCCKYICGDVVNPVVTHKNRWTACERCLVPKKQFKREDAQLLLDSKLSFLPIRYGDEQRVSPKEQALVIVTERMG
jgi:hypothetical protein